MDLDINRCRHQFQLRKLRRITRSYRRRLEILDGTSSTDFSSGNRFIMNNLAFLGSNPVRKREEKATEYGSYHMLYLILNRSAGSKNLISAVKESKCSANVWNSVRFRVQRTGYSSTELARRYP
jgi:hypothetical protein